MAEDCIIPGYHTSRVTVLEKQGQIFPFTLEAHDAHVFAPFIFQEPDGTYRMFYTGFQAGLARAGVCVATSTDLVTWTKPDLDLHPYPDGGSTANNLVLPHNRLVLQGITVSQGVYTALVRNQTLQTNLIYMSADGINFNYITPAPGASNINQTDHGEYLESKDIIWTWDAVRGKEYKLYYNQGHNDIIGLDTGLRSIGYYYGPTVNGPWTKCLHPNGEIPAFTATSAYWQYYDISIFEYAGSLWGVVPIYADNAGVDIFNRLKLYKSDDGGHSWEPTTDLIRAGTGTDKDSMFLSKAKPILVDGVWHLIYVGSDTKHNNVNRINYFHLATGIQNPVVANLAKINGTRVIGDGSGVPWGPE